MFKSGSDASEFVTRLKRHLGTTTYLDSTGTAYTKLNESIQLLAYGLMPNHVHLILHQLTAGGATDLLRRVLISYAKYVNARDRRYGPVFDSRFRTREIVDPDHLKMAIAYVHLNDPVAQLDAEFSSHEAFLTQPSGDWLRADLALRTFGGKGGYVEFLNRVGPSIIERKVAESTNDPGQPSAVTYRPIPAIADREASDPAPQKTRLAQS